MLPHKMLNCESKTKKVRTRRTTHSDSLKYKSDTNQLKCIDSDLTSQLNTIKHFKEKNSTRKLKNFV